MDFPTITPEAFREELMKFRRTVCSRIPPKQKHEAFAALTQNYVRLPSGTVDEHFLFEVIADEFAQRMACEMVLELKAAMSRCTCSYDESEEMTAHAPLCVLAKEGVWA